MSTSSKNSIQLLELFGYIVNLDKVTEFIQSHDLLLYVDHALKDANIKSALKHSIKGIFKLDLLSQLSSLIIVHTILLLISSISKMIWT